MKKLMSLLLCAALLVTAAPAAFAYTPENDSDTVTRIPVNELADLAMNDSLVLDDGAVLTRITYDEYVSETATYNGITDNEVIKNEPVLPQSGSGAYYYYGFTKTQALDKNNWFKATLVATLRLYVYNSYAQIEGISGISTKLASGLYLCKWQQQSVSSYPDENDSTSFPCGRIDIMGDGYFYVEPNISVSEQATLEGCGFTIGAAPTLYWTSPELFLRGSYQCY